MSDTIYCPKCGQHLAGTARFCGKCGEPIPTVPVQSVAGRPSVSGEKGWWRWVLAGVGALFFLSLIVVGWNVGRSLVGKQGPDGSLVTGPGDESEDAALLGKSTDAPPTETVVSPTGTSLPPTATSTQSATPSPAPTLTPVPSETPTATPEPVSTSRFTDVHFCTQPCNADGSNASMVFTGGIDTIYARWRYEDVPIGARYERIWESNGQEWAHYDCTWPGPSSATESITLSDPGGLRSGEWTVRILVDGQIMMEESITLTGNVTHWDVPGYFDSCYGKR